MFGLTFTKILFTLVIAVAIWRAFRWWQRFEARRERLFAERTALRGQRGGAAQRSGQRGGAAQRSGQPAVEDTEPCPVCRTYVPVGAPAHCGRSDCPYPG